VFRLSSDEMSKAANALVPRVAISMLGGEYGSIEMVSSQFFKMVGSLGQARRPCRFVDVPVWLFQLRDAIS